MRACLALSLVAAGGACHWAEGRAAPSPCLEQGWSKVKCDHGLYYSADNALWLAGGLGLGAALANTDADQGIRDWYQGDLRSRASDDFARVAKCFGEGQYVFPTFAAAWAAGALCDETAPGTVLGEWGGRCLRSTLVGGPPVLVLQAATGASRPGESSSESDWKPFQDSNGVSGHSFVGALPFVNAAKMTDDPWLKGGLYAASTLPAWSRINDDAHYTSQAVLGWWMAYVAASAVDGTQRSLLGEEVEVVPLPPVEGTAGVGLMVRY
jgi:hypothetical protein